MTTPASVGLVVTSADAPSDRASPRAPSDASGGGPSGPPSAPPTVDPPGPQPSNNAPPTTTANAHDPFTLYFRQAVQPAPCAQLKIWSATPPARVPVVNWARLSVPSATGNPRAAAIVVSQTPLAAEAEPPHVPRTGAVPQ